MKDRLQIWLMTSGLFLMGFLFGMMFMLNYLALTL